MYLKKHFSCHLEKLFSTKAQETFEFCANFVQRKFLEQIYNTIRKSVQLILQHQKLSTTSGNIIKINLKFSHFHIFSLLRKFLR